MSLVGEEFGNFKLFQRQIRPLHFFDRPFRHRESFRSSRAHWHGRHVEVDLTHPRAAAAVEGDVEALGHVFFLGADFQIHDA